jgi:putative hydrolase of the HAD superfamily
LIEPWPSVGAIYSQVAAERALGNFAPELITRRFIGVWNRRQGFEHTKAAWQDVVREVFADLVAPAAIPDLFEAIYARFASGKSWRVPPDVEPCLKALRGRRVKLLVISNFDERLALILEDLGLARNFEHIIASGPLGVHKPSPDIFRAASKRVGLPPNRLLHVGDSPHEDLEGARQAGWAAVLVNRGAGPCEPGCLRSLEDLPEWMARHGAESAD